MRLRAKSFTMTPGDVGPVDQCEAASIFVTYPRPEPHPGMWHGIGVHRFLENVEKHGRDKALVKVKKFKSAFRICEQLDLSQLPKGDREVELIYEPRTSSAFTGTYRDTEQDLHVYMRADVLWMGNGSHPVRNAPGRHVGDFKTGDKSYDPATDEQFKTEAVAVWVLDDRPAEGVHAHVINLTLGEPRWRSYSFNSGELSLLERRLKKIHAKMLAVRQEVHKDGELPTFTPGKHCYSCRARHACKHASKETT